MHPHTNLHCIQLDPNIHTRHTFTAGPSGIVSRSTQGIARGFNRIREHPSIFDQLI